MNDIIQHVLKIIFEVCVGALACEALSEIMTSAKITNFIRNILYRIAYPKDERIKSKRPIRRFLLKPIVFIIEKLAELLYTLFQCGYCFSVWAAVIVSYMILPEYTDRTELNMVINTLVVHRVSNWIHVIYENVRKGRVHAYELDLKITRERNDG